jgi:hypothetical protein
MEAFRASETKRTVDTKGNIRKRRYKAFDLEDGGIITLRTSARRLQNYFSISFGRFPA